MLHRHLLAPWYGFGSNFGISVRDYIIIPLIVLNRTFWKIQNPPAIALTKPTSFNIVVLFNDCSIHHNDTIDTSKKKTYSVFHCYGSWMLWHHSYNIKQYLSQLCELPNKSKYRVVFNDLLHWPNRLISWKCFQYTGTQCATMLSNFCICNRK